MAEPLFNPSHSIAFNLDRGQIGLQGSGERLLVPADAVLALCASAGAEGASDFGRRIGTEAGRRAAERIGDVQSASPETVVNHLGGDLALLGFGSLSLERWGKALVLTVAHSPFGAGGDTLLAAVLIGALQRAFGRDTGLVRLVRDDDTARFLVTSPRGAERVERWLQEGVSWGEALGRLTQASRGES